MVLFTLFKTISSTFLPSLIKSTYKNNLKKEGRGITRGTRSREITHLSPLNIASKVSRESRERGQEKKRPRSAQPWLWAFGRPGW